MEVARPQSLKRKLWSWPWEVLRFFGRLVRRFFVALGVIAALLIAGYFGLESIIETVDEHYADEIDERLDIDRSTIARLHDRAYFAQQSTFVTEDLKTVACISSPEHRTLINDAEDVPPLFVGAILASEDKNFFTHQGIDKMAILRALGKRILGESHSGASTLTMQIAKHLRGGTRPHLDRAREGRRHRHGAADRAPIPAAGAAGQIREHAVLRPRSVRHRGGEPRVFRQAGEGIDASRGRVHRIANQQAGAARSRVRDRTRAARPRTGSRRELGRKRARRRASST